jgi:hypothetical protein
MRREGGINGAIDRGAEQRAGESLAAEDRCG